MPVGIALGSNLGESEEIFHQTILELKTIHQGKEEAFLVSSFYTTTPVECPPQSPLFLNAVVQLETEIAPLELLSILQSMEVKAGRSRAQAYHAPRTLDLDLLYHDSLVTVTALLELPHPRIRDRIFVLKPLVEINPNLILPGWNQTAESYLQILEAQNI
ncbi:MAG: 2-amino-4-hydroxy-6-hydroxymethyldihydropteridine diphosphokinase [Chthoniobacterales bacterium]|nr:2-amino-4-hydroxy-6-hydroxymethyldihydropteridine diphosphokinase [Chthoniobacterales bacterium]